MNPTKWTLDEAIRYSIERWNEEDPSYTGSAESFYALAPMVSAAVRGWALENYETLFERPESWKPIVSLAVPLDKFEADE